MTGAALHAIDRGAGDVVVLLHSSGMSSRQWGPLVRALSGTHRVIAPDFVGAGRSPPLPPGAAFTFHDDVDVVARLVGDVGRFHLVGHSYGGLVALQLALQMPARVRSLALYDPVAFGVLHDAARGADGEMAPVERALADEAIGGTDAWFQVFVDWWNGAGAWRALPEAQRAAFLAVGRKVYLEVSSLLRDRTPASAYAVVAAPALLLTGARTPPAARRVGEVLAGTFGTTLRTIEGAGHMGPITHADVVNALVAAHVGRDAPGA